MFYALVQNQHCYPHAFRRKSGDIVVISVFRPSVLATISSYTISTRTLKLTHMVAMSICATLHYLEFWSDPKVKSYVGWGGAGSEIFTHFYAPGSKERGYIVFGLSVIVCVCVCVCVSQNFNLGHNFCNIQDSNLIFGMHVYLMELHILSAPYYTECLQIDTEPLLWQYG